MKTTLLTIAALALVLVNGTASVRAEDTRSQVAGAAGGASTVSPYFWTENNDAQIHAFMLQAQGIINPQHTASQAFYLGGVFTATALSVRALD